MVAILRNANIKAEIRIADMVDPGVTLDPAERLLPTMSILRVRKCQHLQLELYNAMLHIY
jgi:hypothetical protein